MVTPGPDDRTAETPRLSCLGLVAVAGVLVIVTSLLAGNSLLLWVAVVVAADWWIARAPERRAFPALPSTGLGAAGAVWKWCFAAPVYCAERCFGPRGERRIDDPLAAEVSRWRAALGLGFVIGVHQLVLHDTGAHAGAFADALLSTVVLLALGVPLTVGLFLLVARPADRAGIRPGLLHGVLALGAFAATLAALAGVSALTGLIGGPVAVLIGVLVVSWGLLFLMAAAFEVQEHYFGVADIHPLLLPVTAVVGVWLLNVVSPLLGSDRNQNAAEWILSLGGALSVTALAVWQFHRMRSVHGVRLRGTVGAG
ncbi:MULTISPECIES: hypothetical protein [unclassified Streptomyces]|uniref:hypothetical protein n=1 Tax=unclassified Streptomyces TaxID=2593676 RepID=UPI00278C2AD1|nr:MULTISPECIES: hypothetical protein [unclassified Streptomyces]